MRGRDGKVPPAADLLVCFPSRAHLSLMPKPICSPARPPETGPGHHHRHRHRRKSSSRMGAGNGHGSPMMWAKSKAHHNDVSEPTSPKVTCAGQIKVRAKPSCKDWQSVMEEIERIHNNRKQKRRSTWIESLGFKKDVMQFLTCLRNLRFDFRCFGGFPSAGITSDDEESDDDDEDEDEEDDRRLKEENDRNSNDVFSKWYMILQENQGREFGNKSESKGITPCLVDNYKEDGGGDAAESAPPPNALLLMRCRSAPLKTWPPEEEEKQEAPAMKCGEEYSKFSEEIAKETWIVGGIREMLSRSRSWKR